MYINHSGIKGQRKGVRRFQYANKTYTPAGNERYRPKKGTKHDVIVGTTLAGGSLVFMNTLSKTIPAISTVSLADVSAKTVGIGAAFASGLANIPVSVLLISASAGAFATASVLKSIADDSMEKADLARFRRQYY